MRHNKTKLPLELRKRLSYEEVWKENDPGQIWNYIRQNNIPITWEKIKSGKDESGGWFHYAYKAYLNNKEVAYSEDSLKPVLIEALKLYYKYN